MKILIITPFFPHSQVHHAGGKTVYEMIKYFSKSYDIHLFSRCEPQDIKYLKKKEGLYKSIELYRFRTPPPTNPFRTFLIIFSYLHLSIMANRVVRKGNFDIVQVEHMEAGLLMKKMKNTGMIMDAHDVLSKPAERRYHSSTGVINRVRGWLKWQIIKQMEKYIAAKFDIVFTRSKMDRDILRSANPNQQVTIFPHPVETCKLPPDLMERDENIILFAGAMHRYVNIKATHFIYEKILPLVQDEIKEVKFNIVGNNPPQSLINLAKNNPLVKVTGFVPSILPYYQNATLFVTPLFIGGGIIAKNIEAMAQGLPVVTTTIGNEGIRAIPDRDILICKTPEEFAKAIILLLKKPRFRQEIGENGMDFVKKKFGTEQVFGIVRKSYEQLFFERESEG